MTHKVCIATLALAGMLACSTAAPALAAEYAAALKSGMLSSEDALPATPATLNAPISHQDASVILYPALPELISGGFSMYAPDPSLFTD